MGSANFRDDKHLNTTYATAESAGFNVTAIKESIEKANLNLTYGKLVFVYGYHDGFGIHSTLSINERYRYTGDVEGSMDETAEKLVDDTRYIVRCIEAKILCDDDLDTTEFLKKVIKDLIERTTEYGAIKVLDADEMLNYAIDCNKKLGYDLSDEDGREDLVMDAFRWKFWHEACIEGYNNLIEKMDKAAHGIAIEHGIPVF